MSRRRALVCGYYAPEPDRDSGSRRLMDQLLALRDEGWAVDYIAFNGVRNSRDVQSLGARGIALHDGSTTNFEELVALGCFDLVLFAFWQTAERYLPALRRLSPGTRVIVDSVDLQFLRDARRTLREPENGLLTEDYGSSLVGELNVYAAADAVLTVSSKEAEIIDDLAVGAALAMPVPDGETITPSPIPFKERRGVLFVGSFEHAPNASGVEWLCREVVPRLDPDLLSKHPLMIVGAGLDETVRRYADGLLHVRMVGWVPSITPYLERARVSVVPLLYGAGTKRKLIQTLLTGTPAVSTTIGAEGLEILDRQQVLIADDPESFARGIAELLVAAPLWKVLARGGRKAVVETHGREAAQRCFIRALDQVFSRSPKSPLLPEGSDERYARRMLQLVNQKAMGAIRELLREHVRPGRTVAVLSHGSAELLQLGAWQGWHFPLGASGEYAGHPGSLEAAVEEIPTARDQGADYLMVPITAAHWWSSESLSPFLEAVESHGYPRVAEGPGGTLFALRDHVAWQQFGSSGGSVEARLVSADAASAPPDPAARLIAFYLPQFHPIPENDEWWGEGFTEWNNVGGARPLFPGHYQPHVPADLGFYDLRLPDTRRDQAELARRYGIHGFCYYHYWFQGKRLLERPFDEVLSSGEPDFPFCLCWANEPWSRRWHGRDEDVLQPQRYSRDDDLAHIRWLLPALADDRAIRIDDRPMFIVYQARDLPDPARTVDTWRQEAERAGLGALYLMTVETGWDAGWDATEAGFDAKVLFQPQFTTLRNTPSLAVDGPDTIAVHRYDEAWPALAAPPDVAYPFFETVCPRWDNAPRAGERAVVLHESTPEAYEQWLLEAVSRAGRRPAQERVVFVNAWNEWAEGCHLEPDLRHGRAYLEATARALLAAGDSRVNGRRSSNGSSVSPLLSPSAATRR